MFTWEIIEEHFGKEVILAQGLPHVQTWNGAFQEAVQHAMNRGFDSHSNLIIRVHEETTMRGGGGTPLRYYWELIVTHQGQDVVYSKSQQLYQTVEDAFQDAKTYAVEEEVDLYPDVTVKVYLEHQLGPRALASKRLEEIE